MSRKPAKKKRSRAKATEDYCPKCRAFVVMTRLDGTTTVSEHKTKRNTRCVMSGKPLKQKKQLKRDAMEFRLPGSFGMGKRR